MAKPTDRSLNPSIRDVTRGLVSARDRQIAQVVTMVDAMPARGDADQILAALRPRLARLRPPRPLRFARLLFLPLDCLIVAAPRWRSNQPAIPRTAIPAMAAMVEAALGPLGRAVGQIIDGRTTADRAAIDEAGALLWPEASALLLCSPAPPGWEATGLPVPVYAKLSKQIGALLSQAVALRRMADDAGEGVTPPDFNTIHAVLAGATAIDPEIHPLFMALLLAAIPESAPALVKVAAALGQRSEAVLRHAEEAAAEMLLAEMEAPGAAENLLGGQDLAEAGVTVRRLTILLAALESEPVPAGRRDRVNDLRRRIRTSCQSLFAERVETDLMEPLRVAAGPEAGWALENNARGLRALETEARRAGGDQVYDSLLREAAAALRVTAASGALGQVGALRLMEIMAGPDQALALLGDDELAGPVDS